MIDSCSDSTPVQTAASRISMWFVAVCSLTFIDHTFPIFPQRSPKYYKRGKESRQAFLKCAAAVEEETVPSNNCPSVSLSLTFQTESFDTKLKALQRQVKKNKENCSISFVDVSQKDRTRSGNLTETMSK